jgi:hypothetical protein
MSAFTRSGRSARANPEKLTGSFQLIAVAEEWQIPKIQSLLNYTIASSGGVRNIQTPQNTLQQKNCTRKKKR